MKKILFILLVCTGFSANAQYNNGVIEVSDWGFVPVTADNNMSVVFTTDALIDFVNGDICAFVNGNPTSSTFLNFEDGFGMAIMGRDILCGCDQAGSGDLIEFAILVNGETIVNVNVSPQITYVANAIYLIDDDYNLDFTVEGVPVEFGCTDVDYLEYSNTANIDDGSCEVIKIDGCTDSEACNYISEANFDDGSCLYLDYEQSLFNACCLGNSITTICLLDEDICSGEDVDCITYGCTELWADNYDPFITQDDGSCYKMGCISDWADNYDAIATTDDGSCDRLGCTSDWAENYDALATTDDGSCYRIGCVSDWADNFDEYATDDDESCYRYGCTSNLAVNYDEYATIDNDNCDFDIITHLNMSFDAWNVSVDLSAGWNMFGYGCPSSIDVAAGLSHHTESIIITKDNNGNVYMPEFGFNGIGDFTPGYGYQIKLTEAIEGFSLCDWYVNDIPEDNIVSLQEENLGLIDMINNISIFTDEKCIEDGFCGYSINSMSCFYSEPGYNCEGICIDELACNFGLNQTECVFVEPGYNCYGNEVIVQLGDSAFGGIVFYIDSTGQHGLVSALNDASEGGEQLWDGSYGYSWGCIGIDVDGAHALNIGTGYQNTIDIIIQECISEDEITAAEAAFYFEAGGYSDWYLPSRAELQEMHDVIGPGCMEVNCSNCYSGVGDFSDHSYWSSSELNNPSGGGNDTQAWYIFFGNCYSYDINPKSQYFKVRPIRSF